MRTQLLVFLSVLSFSLLPGSVAGQGEKITRSDFWEAVRSASSATYNSFPRREIETYEDFRSDNKSTLTTSTTEYAADGKIRLIIETTKGDKKVVRESIQIGDARYCREGSGDWKETNCFPNKFSLGDNGYPSDFGIAKDEKGTTFTRKAMIPFSEAGKSDTIKFLYEEVLLRDPEMRIRERTITNSLFATKSVTFRQNIKYEYGVTVKPIEVPIKQVN